ncbi:7 transmembrane receptor (rhodopsin family) domain-containing protein [Phthorimaea operculella]|nr:7 transmembrane receptor (rhodopsin family) domain-containing protein [Phthorimaea operculella]
MYGVKSLVASHVKSTTVFEVNRTDSSEVDSGFNVSKTNVSSYLLQDDEYIFDRTDVRAIFITLYTIVFCCCFFGNLLVILVVTLSRRLRSITNFFLANLAVADLCVGVFCVFQNLTIYLIPSWVFGDFLCKMYQFVHSLSYTASIFILVVICTERYFAIIHPITCKQILTSTRLRMVILGVWITSAAYSAPKFILVGTITNNLGDGHMETICIQHRMKYNSEIFDMVNFGLLYVTPLCVMTVSNNFNYFMLPT